MVSVMSDRSGAAQLPDIGAVAASVEEFLRKFVDGRSMPSNLREAVKYALLGGGKRLRPVLTLWACEAVGGQPDRAMPAAGAIELIHCFSLVHDDLPAMDDDDLRRGRPTLHRHAGEAMAILAGDMMISLAFELVGTQVDDADLTKRIGVELSAATGDMIAGQVYDTLGAEELENNMLARIRQIHRHKTGALIRCACRMGALAGGADQRQLDAITTYAEAVGLMFQVVDDLLDVTQTTEQMGKATGKDADKGRLGYPAVLGIDGTRSEIARLDTEARGALASLGPSAEPLRKICRYMAVRQQ